MYLEAKELIFQSILFQFTTTRISHQDDINTWVDKRMLLDMKPQVTQARRILVNLPPDVGPVTAVVSQKNVQLSTPN